MKKLEFTPGATEDDIKYVAEHMRDTDKAEIWASDNLTPVDALTRGAKESDLLWTVNIDGLPAAIGGVVPLPTDVRPKGGICWMLATDKLKTEPYWFLDESKVVLFAMLMRYDYLTNFVDSRNVICLRWLGWLGFTIKDEAPYGAEQRMFKQVIREVQNVRT